MKPKRENLFIILFAAAILFLALAPVRGQDTDPTPKGLIIVDLRKSDVSSAVIYSSFDKIGCEKTKKELGKITPKLPEKDMVDEEKVNTLLQNRECRLNKENSATGIRWIGGAPALLSVYIIHNVNKAPEISFKEKERETLLESDLENVLPQLLLKLALPKVKVTTHIPPEEYIIDYRSYSLKYRRAYLTVDITMSDKAPATSPTRPPAGAGPGGNKDNPAPPTTPAPQASKKESSTLSLQVITGSGEHWFLSADLLVSKLSNIHYSDKDKQEVIEPTNVPKDIYIGLNYMLGDLFLPEHPKKLFGEILSYRYLYIKLFMMKLAKRPLDSVGFAVGYRLPNLDILKNFSLFAAYVWAKDENITSKSIWKSQLQFGLSFNLDKAVSWLK